jgi:hypothetical protein
MAKSANVLFHEHAKAFFKIRCRLERMPNHLPSAVPEIPVTNVDKAAEYYVNVLGFSFD